MRKLIVFLMLVLMPMFAHGAEPISGWHRFTDDVTGDVLLGVSNPRVTTGPGAGPGGRSEGLAVDHLWDYYKTKNIATATALNANGTNCNSGYSPLGVDAGGNAEGCWQVTPAAIGAQAANADSTGSAGSVKSPTTTGKTQFTGPVNGATAVMTVPGVDSTLADLTSAQTFSGKTFTGPTYVSISSAVTGTGNINLDGVSAVNYEYSNGASTATYTPVFTSRPASGVRTILLTVGGGAGVITMVWTNVTWMGLTGSSTTTTNKKSSYACIVDSAITRCSIIAEAY